MDGILDIDPGADSGIEACLRDMKVIAVPNQGQNPYDLRFTVKRHGSNGTYKVYVYPIPEGQRGYGGVKHYDASLTEHTMLPDGTVEVHAGSHTFLFFTKER